MKLSELLKILPTIDKDPEINHMDAIENYFFNRRSNDYRKDAADFAIKHSLPLLTTANNVYDIVSRYVQITCPKCGNQLHGHGGGGYSDTHTINFKCECGTEAHLSIPVPDGLNIIFPDKVRG